MAGAGRVDGQRVAEGVRTTTTTVHGAEGDVSVVETVRLAPAAPRLPGITQAAADRACRVGLVLVGVLNVVDVILTKWFLRLGAPEGNPIMELAVRSWPLAAIKAVILGALAARFWTRPATATRLALVWAAAGLYVLAAYVNWMGIQQLR